MTSIATRLKASWQGLRLGGVAMYGKAAPFIWPDWRQGTPAWKLIDFESYVTDGFSVNSLIYSAIMYKARAMTAAPLRAWEGDRDEKWPADPGHPLSKLLDRPSPHQSQIEFQGQAIVYLNIAGNNFIWLDRRGASSLPDAMYNLRPDRVFVVPGIVDGVHTVVGYLYVPEGKSRFARLNAVERRRKFENQEVRALLPEDVIHVKLPNPLDPLEGMGEGLSPLGPAAYAIDVDNSVTKYLKLFFQHGVIVPGFFSTDSPLQPKDISAFKERYKEIYGGFENWAREIMVMDKGITYQRLGLTFDEMGFGPIDERSESRILGPFGVPPILIGSRIGLERATYSNYEEARKAFWQDTMLPEIRLFEVEFGYHLHGKDGAFVAYDFDQVPAFQELKLAVQVSARADYQSAAITKNEYRKLLGLEPDPRGNVYVQPLSLIEVPFGRKPEPAPAEEETQPETEQPPATTGDEGGEAEAAEATEDKRKAVPPPFQTSKSLSLEAKAFLWKQVDRLAQSWESRFAEAAGSAFERERRALLARVKKAKSKALRAKQTVDWQAVERDWDEYWREHAGANWREEFMPVVQGVVTDQGAAWNAAFGMQFDVRNLFAEALSSDMFAEFMRDFGADIITVTKADIAALIRQALANGWTVDELSRQLGLTFDRYTNPDFTLDGRRLTDEEMAWFEERQPRYRRDNIARTETMRASNAGSLALFDAWGVVEKKEWLATGDNRTRSDHLDAWARYREGGNPGPIPLKEAFEVGGARLMYPGDPAGPPEQVCQCRCTLLPYFAEVAR